MTDPLVPTPREAARVLLLDADDRLLLIRAEIPLAELRQVWLTSGGGIEAGETPLAAATRELWEETGITDAEIGACVWRRRHAFHFEGAFIEAREHYFVGRIAEAVPVPDNWQETESRFLRDYRWWALPEIVASTEAFAPRELGRLLAPIVVGELPAEPLEIGV